MSELLRVLARCLMASAPYVFTILAGLIILFLLASIMVAIAVLFWWAGWTDHHGATRASTSPAAYPAAEPNHVYLVYLSGIGHISSTYSTCYEDAFLVAIAAQVPGLAIVSDVFPFSVQNESLISERWLGWLWGWISAQRQRKGWLRCAGDLILIRNILYTALSADQRYGPVYNYSVATLLLQSLLSQGYRLGSGAPVTLLGYSGGGQIALATAGYLKATLQAPVQVISLGGVVDAHPALDCIDTLYYLYGTKDAWQRFGQVIFPARWPIASWSRWNHALASGKITMICAGPMVHAGRRSYLDDTTMLESGQSYMAHCTTIIAGLVQQFAGAHTLPNHDS